MKSSQPCFSGLGLVKFVIFAALAYGCKIVVFSFDVFFFIVNFDF